MPRDEPPSAGGHLPPGERWVLLHGTPLTPAVWGGVAQRLVSSGPWTAPALTPVGETDHVQRALAEGVLRDLPEDERVHVVGHSFGGQVALEMALAAPARVRSLTLLCSRDTPHPAFATAAARLRTDGVGEPEPTLRRWFRPAELRAGGPVVDYTRKCLSTADALTWSSALDAIATYDRSGDVGRLGMPVHLIATELDTVSTPAAMADLASRLPHGRLEVLAGMAHLSPFLDPDGLAARLVGSTSW